MNDEPFIKAARGEHTNTIPVWFMRQAGRSLPGYRKLREKYDVLTLARTPELAAQVSIEPIDRLGVDAAILFADIMLLPIAMGIDIEIIDSVGPVLAEPIETKEGIDRLHTFIPERISYLGETIKILRSELKVPLIGFSGAPFTLASYLLEGKPTRTWTKTKRFMYEQPHAWHSLMEKLTDGVIGYLSTQIDAGAQAVQLFDSWVGCLAPYDFRTFVLPHTQRIFSALSEAGVPRIHFGTNTGAMLSDFSNVDAEVISVDWRVDIDSARKIVSGKALQGNLDPAILLTEQKTIEKNVDRLLESLDVSDSRGSHQAYIFNLGHGVLPETDDTKVRRLVEYIHGK